MASSKVMIDSHPHSVARPDQKGFFTNSDADPDPSMCKSYLLSPLETILESLDDYDWEYVSCHDITEAYNVLSTRIRAIAPSIVHVERPLPALFPLKEHSTSLARALKRDIRRALVDPSHSRKLSALYESYSSEVFISDHDIQHTIDLSTLFQDLNDLFHEVLKIASATELPTPNASKTVSLAFWIIQSQQLPSSILEPRKLEIVSALRHALNGQRGLQAKCDSLKAINSFLKRHHALFTTPFLGFLLIILGNLAVREVECRLQACNALSGLVLVKFRLREFPHEAISQETHAFLKPQIPPRKYDTLSQEKFPLHHYLMMALDSESSDTKDPLWAVVTLASLITLSDRWLYTRVDLRFVVDGLFPAFGHKREEVKQLATAAWGSLVWAFTPLPTTHPTWRQPEDPDLADTSLGIRGKAFRFLKDSVKGEKGVLLVRGLLLPRSGVDDVAASFGDVSRALLVTKAMIGSTQPVDYEAGVQVLSRLVSTIGSSGGEAGKRDNIRPNLEMFEEMLLEVNSPKVKDVAKRVSAMKSDHIRALSEAEIVHHWGVLVEIWIEGVEQTLASPVGLPRDLQDVWQSLLLVKADLTQEYRYLTASGAFASQIAGIVTQFLVHSQGIPVQVQRLIAVKRLWSVMKSVFAASWLPAEKILASVLKVNFLLDDERVKAAWSDLCADLISVGIPTLLHVLSTGSEGQKVTRQLWTVLARTWQVSDEKAHWEELVSFLVIPFKSWAISGAEIKLWEGVLRSSMSMAGSNSIEPLIVVDRFLRRLGDHGTNALVAFPHGVSALLLHVDLSGCTALPQSFIVVVNRTLLSNYPPRPELLAACLEIIRHLGRMIVVVPRVLLVQLLSAAEKGMCCWIGDEKAAMLTREHDVVVQQLYCSTLKLLRELPPSLETLVAISPFLSSAFGRLSSSAIGPLTFNEFWRATYHGIEEYQSSYPDCLRACLLGYSDAFGGSIAEGLSMSQGTDSLSIPDSQPLHLDPEEARLSCVSREEWQPSPVQLPLSPKSKKHTSLEPPVKRRRIDNPPPAKIKTSLEFLVPNQVSFNHEQSMLRSVDQSPVPQLPIPSCNVSGESSFVLSSPRLTPRLSSSKDHQIRRKRSPEVVPDHQYSKRRKTESDLGLDRPILQGIPGDLSTRRLSGPPSRVPASPEVPLVFPAAPPPLATNPDDTNYALPFPEVPFSVPPPPESYSQNTDTRKRKRVTDWVNSFTAHQNSGPRNSPSQMSSSGPSTPVRHDAATRSSTPEEEEYDTWEAGAVSMQEIMELQKELVGSDNFVPETDEEELEAETEYDNPENFLGGSQLVISGSKLRPDRSQTIIKRSASTPPGRTRITSGP
ncbi:hypothetical protein C0995_013858 [Termitomyces sp. Mi166|nr:hypothetical protein C0995_013858 [Termitomyces sp. Mi166\